MFRWFGVILVITEKLDNGYIIDEDIIKICTDKIRKHLLNVNDVILRGKHNYENIATALAATSTLVDIDKAIEVIKNFKPVAHRLEFVRELNGVKWYNDSASSSPTRTLAGINAFKEPIVLIAGGYDKNLDYKPIAKPILKITILIISTLHYNKFTFSLNNSPLWTAFLNISKLALAGENKTIWEGFAYFLAVFIASSKLSTT